MKRILFIGMASTGNDRNAWSGTCFQTYQALKKAGFELNYLSALQDVQNGFIKKLLYTYWSSIHNLFHKNVRVDESFYTVRLFSHTLKKFDYTPYDIIFIPTYLSAVCALPKHIKPKIIHLVDATVDSLFNYYSEFSGLTWQNRLEASYLGRKAFKRSDLLIASSDWCKQNAIKQYHINPQKISVIEFGANIDPAYIPAQPKSLNNKKHLNIYWSGVNWHRKGGDIAVECCEELVNAGYSITLNITGIKELPTEHEKKTFIKNYGFLSKNDDNQYKELISIIKKQDIFLFPSKAECSSIALCEANGFGLPCFAYNTGGTENYIKNGENGYMLSLNSSGKEFAKKIIECIKCNELDTLSFGAVKQYKEKLNWAVWGEKVKQYIESLR